MAPSRSSRDEETALGASTLFSRQRTARAKAPSSILNVPWRSAG